MSESYHQHDALLLSLATNSIHYGLTHKQPLPLKLVDYPTLLQQSGATFVTLKRQQQLRGCIGTLDAHRPLVKDLSHNAYAAAFQDPRFPPLTALEEEDLEIHISILSTLEPIVFHSEKELITQLRPYQDGLVLEDGNHRGTFLPAVWESLPNPETFLNELKRKAGLPEDYWSNTLKMYRYSVIYLPKTENHPA